MPRRGPGPARQPHQAAWPDALANLQAAYTELPRAQLELERRTVEIEQARHLFERVIESMSEALFLLDYGGRVIQANRAAAALLERDQEDLVGSEFPELCGTAKVPATPWQIVEQSPAGSLRNLEVEFRTCSGKAVPVSASCGLVRDGRGKIVGMLVVAWDITDRRRMERERTRLLTRERAARAQAESTQQRFALLAEVSSVIATSLDPDARLHDLAQVLVPRLADWCTINVVDNGGRFRRAAVATADAARLDLLREVRERYPPGRAGAHPMLAVLQTGESELVPSVTEDWLAARAEDGEHLRLLRALGYRSYICVPLAAHGRLLGTISLVRGDSGRAYTEGDLALADDVARRTALALDNARLFKEAQHAVRVRDEFLGIVSHDLKTPLTIISGYAQLLQRYLRTQDPTRVADGLQRIEHATTRMRVLLDELLDIARLQAGETIKLEYRTADLVALVKGAASEQERTSEQHRVIVVTDDEALPGRWDPVRLERVLDNLLSNAIKYSPRGGQVEVRVRRETGWAVVKVCDQGIGIPAADLPHVFERFRRAANVGAIAAGAGLGLAGAEYIVQQHGGTIAVESREGSGSTFTVRLPLVPPDVE